MAYHGRENTDASSHKDNTSFSEQEPDTLQNFQQSSGFVLNTEMAQEKMEMDLDLSSSSSSADASFLRRSNSIPFINGFGDNSQGLHIGTVRMRRNSSPFLNHHALLFLPARIHTFANRIFQIKQEEGMDIAIREAMYEREIHTAMQICQSWEETLNLNDTMNPFTIRNIKLFPVSPKAFVIKTPGKNPYDHHNL